MTCQLTDNHDGSWLILTSDPHLMAHLPIRPFTKGRADWKVQGSVSIRDFLYDCYPSHADPFAHSPTLYCCVYQSDGYRDWVVFQKKQHLTSFLRWMNQEWDRSYLHAVREVENLIRLEFDNKMEVRAFDSQLELLECIYFLEMMECC